MFKIDEIQTALQENEVDWVDNIEYFESIDSTNTYLMQGDESIHGHLCIADFQTHGKGRQGKRWLSDIDANLMFSLGWSPLRPVGAELSLVVGVAIADALKHLRLTNVSLKWPNDVLVEHAKIAGVLIESRTRGRQTEYVIGVGMNINSTPNSMHETRPWASLKQLGHSRIDRPRLLIDIVREVSRRFKQLECEGFAPIRVDWLSYHAMQGISVSYKAAAEDQIGKIVGLDAKGALLIKVNGKIITVNSGEINTLREVS